MPIAEKERLSWLVCGAALSRATCSVAAYCALLQRAAFRLRRVTPTASTVSVIGELPA
jgi:hypothetical protein